MCKQNGHLGFSFASFRHSSVDVTSDKGGERQGRSESAEEEAIVSQGEAEGEVDGILRTICKKEERDLSMSLMQHQLFPSCIIVVVGRVEEQ